MECRNKRRDLKAGLKIAKFHNFSDPHLENYLDTKKHFRKVLKLEKETRKIRTRHQF